jgi:hypothetical protein
MCRRMAALVVVCWAVGAPGPAATRLPDGVVRAVNSISADDLRNYVGTLATRAAWIVADGPEPTLKGR